MPPAPSPVRPVLVTGGAGFIGSHLTESLLAEGRRVIVLDDLSTGAMENLRTVSSHPGLQVIQTSVSGCRELEQLVGEAVCVYHLAAAVGVERVLASPLQAIETNLRETQAILAAARRAQTPVLLASSSEVYGKSGNPALSEEDDLLIGPPTHPRWSYACSKLMDEFLALASGREHGVPVRVTRLFNTVGPRQTGRYGMVLPRFIESARTGNPIRVYGDGTQTRCFCDVADTVEALLRIQAAPAAAGQIVNVGSTEEITILALAMLVKETLASTSSIEFVPYEKACDGGLEDFPKRKPGIEKLIRLTGFRPRIELKRTILRAAGPLAGG